MSTSNAFSRVGFKAFLSLGVGLTALAATQAPAYAQEAGDEASSRTLQTVTITATKREQTLQDVPVAVSVVDSSVIEQAEIVDLNDLQSIVPSLRIGQYQTSANTNFIIRGFGNGDNNAGIEPSVGVFIDGVYRSRSAAQISDLPNIQRVEVLRGPQSTLFGKNASAGVISIITEKPQYEWGGSAEATVGRFNLFRVAGDVTGPISDTVAFSLGANYNSRDGYIDDLNTGIENNNRDRWGVRGQLLIEPTEDLSFRIIGDMDQINENCCAAANIVNGETGAAVMGLGGMLDVENPFSYNAYTNLPATNKIENSGLSLQADYDMGFAELTSITSYRTSELDTDQDSDFTSADLLSRNANLTDIETFTQEIRLTSNGTGQLDWMVGAFYFDETVDIENQILYGDDTRAYIDLLSQGLVGILEPMLFNVPTGTFFQPGVGMTETYGQDNTAFSLFGTLDYHVTDRLTATVGLNYTQDNKDAFGSAVSTDGYAAIELDPLNPYITQIATGALLTLAGVDPSNPAQVAGFATAYPDVFAELMDTANGATSRLQLLQFFPQFVDFPNIVESGSTNDSDTTYTLRLAYDATDNVNVYASFATGFKASSWNLSRDSRPTPTGYANLVTAGLNTPNLTTGTRFAGPEESEVIEIGMKGAWDTFAVNLAVFDQKIEGFQSNIFTGTGFALANAGEQSTQGLEVDATWNPTENLTLGFAGTFLDPVYDSFENSSAGDISGTKPSGISEVSTSASALYTFTFEGLDAFVRGDWQYEGPSTYRDDPAEQAIIADEREYSLFNASVGFTSESGLNLTFWGRNIFDEQYVMSVFPSVAQLGSFSGYPSQPATYGVTVRKTF
ncbi:TonB-dependent receptor domain-containing protein [uncultured Hyphomonas sp.]|uniref:TonB-dependent receptor n=1 Tax=uncultured Hyphomonas sp. TaxID=225298 RepID=UPI002AAB826A|nr:TonB-dependent receptor [uncultured Hyphomonas sp.]